MNPDDNDAWDLATLAAQVLRRQSSPSGAVDAAWALYESAKDKLEEVRLRADLESPEAQAAWEKQEAERLASLTIPYQKGVKVTTSKPRWDRALNWFKRFLTAKAKKEQIPKDREAWVEAQLAHYRSKGFTGAEAKKLKEEFTKWRRAGKAA
jgi:hypothetical protein